ncbi:MAG TPA: hypothetical protein VHU41_04715 [Thermoanaerobaculia bacterium]|nr:hypothetical protein [Thermoanaerobaculia bacterium]
MAELPQPIADHLDEIRELCTRNHVLRLSFVDDPSSRVPNFIAEFEPHSEALIRGRRFHAVWSGLFDFVGDNNLTTPAMIEEDRNPFRLVSRPQLDIYAAERRSA